MIDEKNGEKFGGMGNNTYLCRGINKERTNMTTMTLNIQDNSIMPYLLEMLGKVKGVSIVCTANQKYTLDDSLSKEEGEQLVCETLIPAYRDVLKAETSGKEYPDITELISEIEG